MTLRELVGRYKPFVLWFQPIFISYGRNIELVKGDEVDYGWTPYLFKYMCS